MESSLMDYDHSPSVSYTDWASQNQGDNHIKHIKTTFSVATKSSKQFWNKDLQQRL